MRQAVFRRPPVEVSGVSDEVSEHMGAPADGAPSGVEGETMCPNCGCEFMPGETPDEYQERTGGADDAAE